MAIQKINLGTEPLGEGGDTYRSANTKINENFSNTTHAASKLVGTEKGQVPLIGSNFFEHLQKSEHLLVPDNDLDNLKGVTGHTRIAIGEPIANRPTRDTYTIQQNTYTDGGVMWAYGARERGRIWVRNWASQSGDAGYSDWGYLYTSANTTRDSNTNLIVASEDGIPNSSVASKLVGTARGRIPLAEDTAKAAFSENSVVVDSVTSNIPSRGVYGITRYENLTSDPFGTGRATIISIATNAVSSNLQIAVPWATSNGEKDVYIRYQSVSTATTFPWGRIYTSANTKLDTNGAIAPSSPTIDLYSDHIETNDDGSKMNPEFIRNGVGDYTIKNTTGLRDDGWYIKIPNDMNGNPKVAVAIDTDKDGNLNIKTYKRTFSLETFTFGPDLSEPLDIPEGRWIDLRFNDLPQEELDESEEEPMVDEVVEPEVVEEPTEEPAEESK